MNKFEEALHSLHEQRVQKLKVDKVLAQLANGTKEEKEYHQQVDKVLAQLANGTKEEKEYAVILENALVNSSYNNQTIVDALKAVDIEVSLSAVRTWRMRRNDQG